MPNSLIKNKASMLRDLWEPKITEAFDKCREPHKVNIDNNLKQLMIFQNPKNIFAIKRIEEEKKRQLKDMNRQELSEQADFLCTSQLSIVRSASL